MKIHKSDLKEWANHNWKGVQNCLLPSFTSDMKDINEDGISWDVQQSIRHGFFCTLCLSEAGVTRNEAKRFLRIAAEESKGRILTSILLEYNTFQDQVEMLKYAESVGFDSVLLGYPCNFYPKTADEIYSVTKDICELTNMAIVLFPSFRNNFTRFDRRGFPADVFAKLAEIENVIGLKIGVSDIVFAFECFRHFGSKILVNYPFERLLPIFVSNYGQRWIGASHFELYQSPDKPYLVNYFNLLLEGRLDDAMDIYWKLSPVREVFESQLMASVLSGSYHFPQWKYYQWLVGGNGGMTRQPAMKLQQTDMDACKDALKAIGIMPREPDDEFFTGRVSYRASRE